MQRFFSKYKLYQMTPLLLTVLLSAACHLTDNYHQFRTLRINGWEQTDTLVFDLPRQKSSFSAFANIEIRYSGTYPYRSIWLEVKHNELDSTVFQTDTVECSLVNSKGTFDGTGISDLYQKSFPLTKISIKAHHAPKFKITHCMTDKQLKGIINVGIKLSYEPRQSEGK